MTISQVDKYVIWFNVVLFNVFGQFGNLNVIYAHRQCKKLRTKHGFLIVMLVSSESICLAYELVGVVFGLSGITVIRRTCFLIISPAMFMVCFQTAIMAAMSIDLLFSIVDPLRHRSLSTKTYLTLLVMPAVIFGTSVVLLGGIFTDTEQIDLCQPPFSLTLDVRRFWLIISLSFNIVTLAAYLLSFLAMFSRYKEPKFDSNGETELRAMKSIAVCLIIFITSRLSITVLGNVFDFLGFSEQSMERMEAYFIFCAMACYSSTYYLFFIKSAEYRKLFLNNISSMLVYLGIKPEIDRQRVSSMNERSKTEISLASGLSLSASMNSNQASTSSFHI